MNPSAIRSGRDVAAQSLAGQSLARQAMSHTQSMSRDERRPPSDARYLPHITVAAPTLERITASASMQQAPSAVVVGAGIAGLTAARDLKQAGWRVTVLEARPRLGGRLLTCLEFGLATEMGGEFIDSARLHPQVHALTNDLSVPLVSSGMQRHMFALEGKKVTPESLEQVAPGAAQAYERFWVQAEALAAHINTADVLSTPFAQALDRLSVAKWMDTLDLPAQLRPLIRRELALEYGDPAKTSLLHFALHTKLYTNAHKSEIEAFRIQGGTQALIQALADSLNSDVQCQSAVTAVDWHADGVTLKYSKSSSDARCDGSSDGNGDDASDQSLSADYMVVATPLAPLRQVTFSPALPDSAQSAISNLTYADHSKTVLYFDHDCDESMPPEDGPDYVQTSGPLGGVWRAPRIDVTHKTASDADDDATDLPTGPYALVCYNLASEANINGGDEAQRESNYRAVLSALVGHQLPQAIRVLQQNWQSDIFSGGSFSAYGPGEVSAYWQVLREPIGPIVFAGEHTAQQYTGYIEGAVESGHRAAKQLLACAALKQQGPFDELRLAPQMLAQRATAKNAA